MDILFLLARLFCGASFIYYNYIGFRYVEKVLSSVYLSNTKKIGMSIFNTVLYLALSSSGLSAYMVYLCGLAMLALQFGSVYKLRFRRIIYVACTFMFNIAALRNFVLSAFALGTFQPIDQISRESTLYNFALAISFFILDIIMLLFIAEKIVTFENLAVFAKAKMQEIYAAVLSSLAFGYILLFSSTHAYSVGYVDITILNFFTPIILAALYYVSLSYGIKMSQTVEMERRSRALEFELKETIESKLALEHIAYVDPLTGAFSRRYCIEKISLLLKDDIAFSLCFIDVDCLKNVNDTYGHAQGDLYLQMTADVLRLALRHNDVISRMGGDEFVVLLPNCPLNTATHRMKTALKQVHHLKIEKELAYEASFSYGIIEVDHNSTLAVDELLSKADKLMYEFKIKQKSGIFKD